MTLPEQIERQANICAHQRIDAQDAKRKMDAIEVRISGEIAGDPSFKNENQRKAELVIRLDQDTEYQRWQREYFEIEEERPEHEAHLERLRNEFRLYLLDRQYQIAQLQQGVNAPIYAATV